MTYKLHLTQVPFRTLTDPWEFTAHDSQLIGFQSKWAASFFLQRAGRKLNLLRHVRCTQSVLMRNKQQLVELCYSDPELAFRWHSINHFPVSSWLVLNRTIDRSPWEYLCWRSRDSEVDKSWEHVSYLNGKYSRHHMTINRYEYQTCYHRRHYG